MRAGLGEGASPAAHNAKSCLPCCTYPMFLFTPSSPSSFQELLLGILGGPGFGR